MHLANCVGRLLVRIKMFIKGVLMNKTIQVENQQPFYTSVNTPN
jgi:hypothetical protein